MTAEYFRVTYDPRIIVYEDGPVPGKEQHLCTLIKEAKRLQDNPGFPKSVAMDYSSDAGEHRYFFRLSHADGDRGYYRLYNILRICTDEDGSYLAWVSSKN